jgi:general secretion pathway protein L
MSHLLITLSSTHSANAEWDYALISHAGMLTSHGTALPALLPEADQATLLLPAQALSWHAAQLPLLSRNSSAQKQQAMLAGVLEEQLLDDVAQMHLAACPTLSNSGKTWVAAAEKASLLNAVKVLQAAHVPLNSIAPLAFPGQMPGLHVSGTPSAAWLTYTDAQGVLCIPLSQAVLLPHPLPETLLPSAEPAVAALAEQVLGQRVNVLQAPQWMLQAMQAAKAQGVDLAQGDLAVSQGGRAWQSFVGGMRDVFSAPAWRAVRYGLGLLLLAHVIGLNAWAWKESTALHNKKTQINQLLTQSFPNVKVVVDAPLQMQRELATLRQSQGQLSGRDFESIYSRFSALALINTAPNAIEFIANEVQIKGLDFSAEQLNALQPRLQYAGLSVRSEARSTIVSHRDALAAPAALTAGGKP